MTPLAWCATTALAAALAATAGLLLRRRARRRAAAQAAQARLATLRAHGYLAIDPEATFLRMLADHPELHNEDA
jgi:hypothetical protein